MIIAKKTYVTTRPIRLYSSVDWNPGAGISPVCVNSGPSILAGSGTKVCVAHFSTSSNARRSCALMTTPSRDLGPVYGWIDEDDLLPLESAEEEGITPHFI